MNAILGVISWAVLATAANRISEQCKIHEETTIKCRCIGNEEFSLPEGYNYENVTSLRIECCSFANLYFSSLTEANRIAEIVVQNISERLIFELFLTSKKMKRLKLSKIRRVPLISRDTFVNLNSIESLRIEDTRIDKFEERFTDLTIGNFSMVNVTIGRVDELNLSQKGDRLRIENTEFRNVTGSLNFAHFSSVEIVRSAFRLGKPGYVLIEGDFVFLEDCVFSNASANLVATSGIEINGTCADGKSSMRLSSSRIESANNRLPTEIVYTGNKGSSEGVRIRNNTVCIAGNCKCAKSAGSCTLSISRFLSSILLLLSTPTFYR